MEALLGFVGGELLPVMESLSSENIGALQGRLYVLREHCSVEVPDKLFDIDHMLAAGQGLWDLINEHKEALADLSEIRKVRNLGLGADLLGQFEEALSGEDSLGDFLLTSIATFLGWKSNSKWVEMAQQDCAMVANSHMIRVQGLMWQIVSKWCLANQGMSMSKVTALGDKLSKLLPQVFNGELPPVLHVTFIAQIYILLLYVYLARLVT